MLGDQVRHLAVVVGAGVIGGGEEVEGVGAVSIMLGAFPPETSFEPFVVEPGRDGRRDAEPDVAERADLGFFVFLDVLLVGDVRHVPAGARCE